jgi:23S rRNA pseudouridine955/2504/2580 synthase
MNEWLVSEAEAGLTVLELLQRRLPEAPTAYLRQLLRGGKIRQSGQPLGAESKLPVGARLSLPDSQRLSELQQAAERAVEVLSESPSLLVVFKPAGLAVHRGVGHEKDNLTERVRALVRRRREPFKIAPIHRLDVETSGPVIFGKGARAIAGLGKQFMERQVEKVYLALVSGRMPASGLLTSPVPAKAKLKEAATAFRALSAGSGYSLLELRLQTGRTHQIRRQLADAGHPLAGDSRYRGPTPAGLSRLFLHCCRLSLRDPFDLTVVDIVSELPAELADVLSSLGMGVPDAVIPKQRETPDQPPNRR